MRHMEKRMRVYKFKTVVLYLIFGGLWILFSDQAVALLVKDPAAMTGVSIAKGWLFILFTALLLYLMVSRGMETANQWNRKFRSYFEQALVGMIVVDPKGLVTELNPLSLRILGLREEQLRGSDDGLFTVLKMLTYPEGDPVDLLLVQQEKERGVLVTFDVGNGVARYIHMTASEYDGNCVLMFIDVTDKVNMEVSLVEMNIALEDKVEQRTAELKKIVGDLEEANKRILVTERMTALGELASGISGEISTPVGIAVTAVSYMGVEVEKLSKAVMTGHLKRSEMEQLLTDLGEAHDLARRNLEKASEVIGSFKQMSTDIGSNQKRYFKMSEIVSDTIISLRPFIRKGDYRFDIRLGADEPIYGYPGAISQILSNFILNAIQHGFSDRQEGRMTISSWTKDQQLAIEFEDDGVGILEEHRQSIFRPYYTIHQAGNVKGTGLGLSILYKLVSSDLNGTIECFEGRMGGAGFRVVIPVTDVNHQGLDGLLRQL